MKTVLLVNISPVYISNDTCQPVELTDDQKLLSSVFTREFTFVELYTPIRQISAKTFKEIAMLIDDFSTQHKIYDFQSIILNK